MGLQKKEAYRVFIIINEFWNDYKGNSTKFCGTNKQNFFIDVHKEIEQFKSHSKQHVKIFHRADKYGLLLMLSGGQLSDESIFATPIHGQHKNVS